MCKKKEVKKFMMYQILYMEDNNLVPMNTPNFLQEDGLLYFLEDLDKDVRYIRDELGQMVCWYRGMIYEREQK